MGILSERDIVRVLAERGASVLSQPLASVMTRKVVTCRAEDDLQKALDAMTDINSAIFRSSSRSR